MLRNSSPVKSITHLAEFRDVYEAGEILQIGTLIIELAQAIVLRVVTLTKEFKCVDIIGPCIWRKKLAGREANSDVRTNVDT